MIILLFKKVDEKGRDLDISEDHLVHEADERVAGLVLVANSGLQQLKSQLDSVRSQVSYNFIY